MRTAHELPRDLYAAAGVLVTDAPEQAASAGEDLVVSPGRLLPLGAVTGGRAAGRTGSDEITVFCSLGLAGTEVLLAQALAKRFVNAAEPREEMP